MPIRRALLALSVFALAVLGPARSSADLTPCDRAQSELKVLARQITTYAAKHDALPAEHDWYQALEKDGLVLAGGERDPWGHQYVYVRHGEDFDLRTVGRDGKSGTADDQVRAQGWRWSTCSKPKFWSCGR